MYILFFLSVVSCPQEAIITRIVKSLATNLWHTVTLALGHHTVIAGAVRNETYRENRPIGVLPQGDTLQSVQNLMSFQPKETTKLLDIEQHIFNGSWTMMYTHLMA